jgi:nitrogen fixation protein FixH
VSPPTQSRNLWPIAIIGFFVVAILFIVTFIAWAVRQRNDLVSADYYEREVRFQSQLDSMNRSQPLATQTVVTFESAPQTIVITLPVAQVQGATGSVHLYRPSDARLDRELPLALSAAGIQRVDAKDLRDGLWKVRVKWSVGGTEYFIDQPVIVASGVPVSQAAPTAIAADNAPH